MSMPEIYQKSLADHILPTVQPDIISYQHTILIHTSTNDFTTNCQYTPSFDLQAPKKEKKEE